MQNCNRSLDANSRNSSWERGLRARSRVYSQSPHVSWNHGLKSHVMLFEAGELGNPNDAKLHFVLAVLNGQSAADLELAVDETQPDTGFGDVQGMSQIAVRATGTVIAGNSYRQNCFGAAVAASVVHFETPCWLCCR